GLQVGFRIGILAALAFGPLGDPPRGVGPQAVLRLEPVAAFLLGGGAAFLDEVDPLLQGTAGLLRQVGDPFHHHGDAGMDAVKGTGLLGHGAVSTAACGLAPVLSRKRQLLPMPAPRRMPRRRPSYILLATRR